MKQKTPFQTSIAAKPASDLHALAKAFPFFTVERIRTASLYKLYSPATPQSCIYASYRTPVAVFHGDILYILKAYFSPTTSRHISEIRRLLSYPKKQQSLAEEAFQDLLTFISEDN